MPIPLISKIKPQNGAAIPMYDDVDAYGGYQSRVNHADRDSIPTACRKTGMIAYTQNDGFFWQLQSDLVTWELASFNASAPDVPNGLIFAGDLTGTNSSQTVVGIQGHGVANPTLEDGFILIWNQADGYWLPQNPANAAGAGFNGVPSNDYGGGGNKLLIPATETILASNSQAPGTSAVGTLTTTNSAWNTILARIPQGTGRWQVTIVGKDGLGNEFSAHLDFHVNGSSVTFPSAPTPTPAAYPLMNVIYVGGATSYSAQAIFAGGQVLIQVRNFTGTSGQPVSWGAWLQDLTRL